MTKTPRIGVLALQGDVREHLAALRSAGAEASKVRRSSELDVVDALVIPGGESTTIGKLLVTFDLLEPLQKRYYEIMAEPGYVSGVLNEGAERVSPIANSTVELVKERMGLYTA